MKTFEDLQFRQNSSGVYARLEFDNGYILSVVAGKFLYCTPKENLPTSFDYSSFEVAVFSPNSGEFTREFFEDHDANILGWQSREQINNLISLIESKSDEDELYSKFLNLNGI